MTSLYDAKAYLGGTLGLRVSRTTAALPAGTTQNIFTVAGKVLLTAFWGEVTTIIQAQANALKLQYDPTDTGASADMCTTIETNGLVVGTMLSIDGTPGNAMVSQLNWLPANKTLARGILLKPGTLALVTAATNTGSVKWDLTYIPMEAGAAVTAL